jgi:phenylacetate-CoA ligase
MMITFTYATMGAAWACTWASLGAGVGLLPASSGRTTSSERQVDLLRRSGVTAITGTASFILHLAEVAKAAGHDPSKWPVKTIITAGELATPGIRQNLEEAWGARVYDLFGSVDTLTWSSIDCEASRCVHGRYGMHIWEDACCIQVLDSEGKPVTPGQYGEMCITSWAWRSSPKIRFRTGDLIAVEEAPCECGRMLKRMMPVAGRVDHVLRIRATTFFPMAIENAILQAAHGTSEWMAEAVATKSGDRLRITIESANPGEPATAIEHQLRSKLGSRSVDVRLVPPGSTVEATGAGRDPKVQRIFDRRRVH